MQKIDIVIFRYLVGGIVRRLMHECLIDEPYGVDNSVRKCLILTSSRTQAVTELVAYTLAHRGQRESDGALESRLDSTHKTAPNNFVLKAKAVGVPPRV